MTQNGKRRAKWLGIAGGGVAVLAALYGMRDPLQGTGRAMLNVPSRQQVSQEIADSLRTHVVTDGPWRASVMLQLQAIRCAQDSIYRKRNYEPCTYAVKQ